METVKLVLSIVQVLICVFIIVAVLMQQGASEGLGAVSGGSETFFGKSGARGMQGTLSKCTAVAAIVFGIIVIVLSAL